MHIGCIMDGNRTWARSKGLPQFEGHRNGYENMDNIIRAGQDLGLEYMSFWALSDDNITSRSPEEVKYLFELLEKGLKRIKKNAKKETFQLHVVGDRSLLPESCQRAIIEAEESTLGHTDGMQVILAIAYGGQEEIARAVRALAKTGKDLTDIKKEDILEHLETASYPPVDLIVRTGGHMRHSGYFLYQSPYAEYFFSDLNWPDFNVQELHKAYESFSGRIRKFGK